MESISTKRKKVENQIKRIEGRIESLKVQYNLFFAGELNVPPESEREKVEKIIRDIQSKDLRSGKLSFLLQNLASRFYLYNNMWLKKLNQIETGVIKKTTSHLKEKKIIGPEKVSTDSGVSLNNEHSFDEFYSKYEKLVKKGSKSNPKPKDNLVNSIKLKMISENIIDANIKMEIVNGKVKIKIKK